MTVTYLTTKCNMSGKDIYYIITVIIPIWGWIIAVGGGLIYCGWCLIGHNK